MMYIIPTKEHYWEHKRTMMQHILYKNLYSHLSDKLT